MLAVRRGDFIPVRVAGIQHNHFTGILVSLDDRGGLGCFRAQAEGPIWRGAVRRINPINQRGRCRAGNLQIDLRSHGCRYRCADNVALHQPLPLAIIVNRMNQGQFIFAVEGFRYLAGGRIDWSEAVIGEIRARGIIDTNQCSHPFLLLDSEGFSVLEWFQKDGTLQTELNRQE